MATFSYGMFYAYWDPTYWMVIVGGILCLIASARVKSTYNKFSKRYGRRGITGAMAAQMILARNGIADVSIEMTPGNLTDHYDPKQKVLRLSANVYQSSSVAAVGVAAHECGHAIQHQQAYYPLIMRSTIVPVVNFGSMISWPLIIIGLMLGRGATQGTMGSIMVQAGILLFTVVVLFQLITLPVEFNASKRAMIALEQDQILEINEQREARKVLNAAALTYVASAAAAILQLLRLLMLFGGRSRD